MTRLFTTWYDSGNVHRQLELEECFRRNLNNPFFDKICLWQYSGSALSAETKLVVRQENRQADFNDFFEWINAVSQPDDIAIIANTDIWFDETIGLAQAIKPDQCFVLLRMEKDGKHFVAPLTGQPRWDAQDAWIFRAPVRAVSADFGLGSPRNDNALAYRLRQAGYDVRNPALDIHIHHLHDSDIRRPTYNHVRIPPPWLHVEPGNIEHIPKFKMLSKRFNVKWWVRKLIRQLTPKDRRPR